MQTAQADPSRYLFFFFFAEYKAPLLRSELISFCGVFFPTATFAIDLVGTNSSRVNKELVVQSPLEQFLSKN